MIENSASCYHSKRNSEQTESRLKTSTFLFYALTAVPKFSYNLINLRGKDMKKVLLGFFVALVLAGCGQIYDREPVGVGYDNNELKLSPCACIMVYQA